MALIDIGSPAIDRPGSGSFWTYIDKNNPANASGKITSIEIWAAVATENCEVATFDVVSGNTLSTRDTHFIGAVTAGSKQTFSDLNLTVETGDYIGIYYTFGGIERSFSGGVGLWHANSDQIPCTNFEFTFTATEMISLYGTGMDVPAQVTGVSATDGVHTDKVRVTWNSASGATKYYVWNGSGWVDVGTNLYYDHTAAPAPTITPGSASASDGEHTEHVALSLSGQSANNGSPISYKVKAWNPAGYGAESASDPGYRGVGSLTYQWQRSAGDSDADYSNIDGATTASYNDTEAPENGDGRYYRCVINATGAAQQISTSDRGYRIVQFEYVGTGSFAYSGTATIIIGFTYVGTGTFAYSGTATIIIGFTYVGSGEFTYSGTAITTIGFVYIGSGDFVTSGSGSYYYFAPDWEYIGSGTYNFSGVGLYSLGLSFVGIGEFIYSGSATQIHTRYYLYEGSGVFIYAGMAVHRYIKFWSKVIREKEDWTKVEKEKDDWDKVDREKRNWEKKDRG